MAVRIWRQSPDNRFRWETLSAKYLPGVLSVLKTSFFVNETICRVVGIAQTDKGSRQFEDLVKTVVQNGVSVVAVEVESDTVVGIAVNRIQVKGDSDFANILEKQIKSTDSDPAYQEIVNFILQMEQKIDIFEYYGVTAVLDHMFLATHVNYYQKGIGRGLVAATVDMARAINRGEDVGVPISDDKYPWKNKKLPQVQAIIALFTSPITQKIGKYLGWDEIFVARYDQLFYNGESYSSRLDKNNQTTAYMSIKIDK